ncbi:hypothetical protein AALA17_03465 [Lactobacillaceae bacterium 24-114]
MLKNKNYFFGLAFALGLFLMAGFTVDKISFNSSLLGIIGSFLIVGSYLGFNWEKIKNGDHHTRKIAIWISSLLLLVIILNIVELALS